MREWALFHLAGALYLAMPALTWVAMSGRETRAGNLWCLGGLLMGVGAILTASRATLPDWISIHIGMTFLMMAGLVRLEALWLDLGRQLPRRKAVLWLVLALGVSVLSEQLNWRGLMVLSNRFNLALTMGLISVALWALHQRNRSLNLKLLAFFYMTFAFLMISSALWPLVHGADRPDTADNPVMGWLAMAGAATAVFGHLAYLGYVFEQSLARRRTYDQDVVADQEVFSLSQKLAELTVRAQAGQQAAWVAHEVNQPLAAIQIQAQLAQRLLLKPVCEPAILTDLLGKIEQQIDRLVVLVQGLRVQPSEQPGVCGAHEPLQLLQETLDLLRQDPRWAALTFHLTGRQTAAVGLTPGELTQLLFNLLRNAAEAVGDRPNGSVRVGWDQQGGWLRLIVEDNGPGFDPIILAALGRPFATTKSEGLGVGLAICLKLAQHAGGRLSAANLAPSGARVEVMLPIQG